MSGCDLEDNTAAESGPGMSTNIGTEKMPSTTCTTFADLFNEAALVYVPVLSQLTI